jgi:hypothetical protein
VGVMALSPCHPPLPCHIEARLATFKTHDLMVPAEVLDWINAASYFNRFQSFAFDDFRLVLDLTKSG